MGENILLVKQRYECIKKESLMQRGILGFSCSFLGFHNFVDVFGTKETWFIAWTAFLSAEAFFKFRKITGAYCGSEGFSVKKHLAEHYGTTGVE